MIYLLDTNAIIAVLNQNLAFIARLKQHHPADFSISVISLFELYYGAYKSRKREENLAKLDKLPFAITEFSARDAQIAGEIRSTLGRQGTPIGSYDILIAAQALNRQYTLITHNVREFERVNGLQWQDWQH